MGGRVQTIPKQISVRVDIDALRTGSYIDQRVFRRRRNHIIEQGEDVKRSQADMFVAISLPQQIETALKNFVVDLARLRRRNRRGWGAIEPRNQSQRGQIRDNKLRCPGINDALDIPRLADCGIDYVFL
jgi:hypothetical protein